MKTFLTILKKVGYLLLTLLFLFIPSATIVYMNSKGEIVGWLSTAVLYLAFWFPVGYFAKKLFSKENKNFRSWKAKKISQTIMRICKMKISVYEERIAEILKNSGNSTSEEINKACISARKAYLDAVYEEIFNGMRHSSRVYLYLVSVLHTEGSENGVMAGKIYYAVYQAMTNKTADPADCIAMNHMQNELMQQVLTGLEVLFGKEISLQNLQEPDFSLPSEEKINSEVTTGSSMTEKEIEALPLEAIENFIDEKVSRSPYFNNKKTQTNQSKNTKNRHLITFQSVLILALVMGISVLIVRYISLKKDVAEYQNQIRTLTNQTYRLNSEINDLKLKYNAFDTYKEKAIFLDENFAFVNEGSKKYHKYGCIILNKNKAFYYAPPSEMEEHGYTPCSHCH